MRKRISWSLLIVSECLHIEWWHVQAMDSSTDFEIWPFPQEWRKLVQLSLCTHSNTFCTYLFFIKSLFMQSPHETPYFSCFFLGIKMQNVGFCIQQYTFLPFDTRTHALAKSNQVERACRKKKKKKTTTGIFDGVSLSCSEWLPWYRTQGGLHTLNVSLVRQLVPSDTPSSLRAGLNTLTMTLEHDKALFLLVFTVGKYMNWK